ncbi:MAG: DUF2442 domain-containing protein [Desulfomonile tiedjei]|nr:DUF2442 domain-containing protein [Desulfomonile tiedjei]
MKSELPGTAISEVEVTNISRHGLWLLVGEEELFLPLEEFPWFKDAPLQAILTVQRQGPEHLHWPDLDVDLTLDSIRHPQKYPLMSKVNVKFAEADSPQKSSL